MIAISPRYLSNIFGNSNKMLYICRAKKVIGFSKRLRIVDLLLPYHRASVMTIIWKDPHMRLHGKRHKTDSCYYRWHYGKQRVVYITKEYVDKPTENQKSAREAFTELRREVARQLKDENLRIEWMRRFEADNEGYKMLHTYVYAKLKAGETVTQSPTCRDALLCVSLNVPQEHNQHTSNNLPILVNKRDAQKGVSTPVAAQGVQPILLLYHRTITPLFLPWKVPKRECLRI